MRQQAKGVHTTARSRQPALSPIEGFNRYAPFQPYSEKTVPPVSIVFGDRCCYLRWLFEAKKRFGLSVVNLAELTDRTEAIASTVNALRAGADAIVQDTLEDGNCTVNVKGARVELITKQSVCIGPEPCELIGGHRGQNKAARLNFFIQIFYFTEREQRRGWRSNV